MVVDLRKKVGEAMKLGPLIKYYRTQKGLRQKQLAVGICSIPHLSKIENNSKEANPETINLLLERLNIACEEIHEKESLIKEQLIELNEKISYYFKNDAETIFQNLQKWEELIPFSSYLYTYELYKYRYLLFVGKLDEAAVQRDLLNKWKNNFSQQERYLYSYYNAVFWIMKGKYAKADSILEDLFTDQNIEVTPGEVFYHRALVKSALEESGHAIHFGKLALQSFMNQHNFTRILHTLMLLGINYTHSKIYEEALGCFNHLIRNAELLNGKTLLPQIYHNMGFLQKQMGQLKKALFYFEKCLELQSEDTQHYIITLFAYGDILFVTGERERAKEIFEKLSNLAKKTENKKYDRLSRYFLMALDSHEESIQYLEQSVVPLLEESREHRDDLIEFYKRLAEHHKNLNNYEKAVYYMEKIK